jgi:hypothetical protein
VPTAATPASASAPSQTAVVPIGRLAGLAAPPVLRVVRVEGLRDLDLLRRVAMWADYASGDSLSKPARSYHVPVEPLKLIVVV